MTSEKKTTKKKATKTSTSTKKAESPAKVKKAASTKKAPAKKAAATKKSTKKAPAKTNGTKKASVKKSAAKPAAKKTSGSKIGTAPTANKKAPPQAKPGQLSKESKTVDQLQLQANNTHAAEEPSEPSNEVSTSQSLVRGKFQHYQMKPEEEYMDAPQLEHFRMILNDWKAELMEEVDRTVDHMKDDSANLPDPADRATQEEEFNLELRTRDRERKLIKKIDKTLERIEHDDYGFCDGCGIEIGLRRLEARPTADLCIDCKTLAEIKERQFRG